MSSNLLGILQIDPVASPEVGGWGGKVQEVCWTEVPQRRPETEPR